MSNNNAKLTSLVSFLLASAGALFWTWHVYLRATEPEAYINRLHPLWFFPTYAALTVAAILFLGIALSRAGNIRWIHWFNIGASAIFALRLAMNGNIPPFFFYLVIAGTGIVLIIKSAGQQARSMTGDAVNDTRPL